MGGIVCTTSTNIAPRSSAPGIAATSVSISEGPTQWQATPEPPGQPDNGLNVIPPQAGPSATGQAARAARAAKPGGVERKLRSRPQ